MDCACDSDTPSEHTPHCLSSPRCWVAMADRTAAKVKRVRLEEIFTQCKGEVLGGGFHCAVHEATRLGAYVVCHPLPHSVSGQTGPIFYGLIICMGWPAVGYMLLAWPTSESSLHCHASCTVPCRLLDTPSCTDSQTWPMCNHMGIHSSVCPSINPTHSCKEGCLCPPHPPLSGLLSITWDGSIATVWLNGWPRMGASVCMYR
jgi:hypothetical protein